MAAVTAATDGAPVSEASTASLPPLTAATDGAALYRAILDGIPRLVYSFDPHLRLTFVNQALCQLVGRTAPELVGKVPQELGVPEPLMSTWVVSHRRVLDSGEAGSLETSVVLPNGETRIVEVAITLVRGADGALLGGSGVGQDVTQSRRLQRQLAGRQRLEAIGRLAGGIAHDFNNILTSIVHNVRSLKSALAPGAPHLADAREIERAAERAARVVQQLLAFGRRSFGQPEPHDLGVVLHETARLLRPFIGEHVELRVTAAEGLWVHIDRGHLEQIVANLILNGRETMTDGGRIEVEAGTIELARDHAGGRPEVVPGRYVELRVKDGGPKIPDETLAHLFEPFAAGQAPGIAGGLGLATTFGLVKQAAGYIWARSGAEGNTIAVHLPSGPPAPLETAAPAAPPPPLAPPPVSGRCVLLVEDDESVRTVTQRALERGGFRVIATGTPTEALARASLDEVDLLLTDMVMPGMSGTKLVAALQRRRAGLPAVFMSGYSDDIVAENGGVPKGIEFLPKPFSAEELLGAIRRALQRAA